MIHPLRRRHRKIITTLGVLLPVLFAVGLAARRPIPLSPTAQRTANGVEGGDRDVVWTKTDLWPGRKMTSRLRRPSTGPTTMELSFEPLAKPDVLVYWATPPTGIPMDGLPKDARFLGGLVNGRPIPLPGDTLGQSGCLILYSLADQELVAVSKPFVVETK